MDFLYLNQARQDKFSWNEIFRLKALIQASILIAYLTKDYPSLHIVFCTLYVFNSPQCGQISLKLAKVLDFRSCSLSILTAVSLNSFPQFLQLAITTIIISIYLGYPLK